MNKPLITVIIPFYNEERFIKRAIDSVLCQTHNKIELILVDDGSTDNSGLIVKQICNTTSNCSMISIENSGPGNARNIGIKNVKGSYLAFLDADDVYQKNAIEELFANLINNQADVSVGQFIMLDDNENILKTSQWEAAEIFTAKKAIYLVVSEKLIPTSGGKLFKTEIAEKCKFPRISWKEDDLFILDYLLKSNTVSVVNKPLLTIYCHPNSLTRQTISLKMIDAISSSYKLQEKLLKPLNDSKINNALIESELNTFLNLLILLKIDWKKIKNKKEIWSFYTKQIKNLANKSKEHKISNKKRLLLIFLISSKKLGWSYAFLMLSVFKNKQLHHLTQVKS